MTERAVQTAKNMLFTVCPELGPDWDRSLPAIVEAFRKSSNDGLSGMTPYQVVRGFAPQQQASLLLGDLAGTMTRLTDQPPEFTTPEEYAAFVAGRQLHVQELVSEALRKSQDYMKAQHDKQVPRHVKFYANDRVRKMLPPDQQGPLRYSADIYVVIEEPHEDVYLIKREEADQEEPDTVNAARLKLFARAAANALCAVQQASYGNSHAGSDESSMLVSETMSTVGQTSIPSASSSTSSSSSTASSTATVIQTKRTRKQHVQLDYQAHIRTVKWLRGEQA